MSCEYGIMDRSNGHSIHANLKKRLMVFSFYKCLPSSRHIYCMDCKIIMFKVEKQVFSALSRAKISSLSNFPKNVPLTFEWIGLHFIVRD